MAEDRNIFFDHQSTTPVDKRVVEEMLPYFTEDYGNPSSFIHRKGVAANEALDNAHQRVADLINSKPEEVVFTSGATESNNLAIRGYLRANPDLGRHIIVSPIEHFSIIHQFPELREAGYEIATVGCDEHGMVDPDDVKRLVRDDTVMIILQAASSEIGTIQNVRDIARIAKERKIFLHTDAAIAGGNIPIDVTRLGCDSMSLSAHNMYGPKGAGALYLRTGYQIKPLFVGGNQEFGLRSGTENLPGIVGFGKAAELAKTEMNDRIAHLKKLQIKLWDWLEANVEHLNFTGHPVYRIPGHVSFWVKYIEGESFLLMLNMKGIMCASGSACSSNLRGEDEEDLVTSHVLSAVGVPAELCSGSLTVSFGKDNTEEELDYMISVMPEVVEKLLMMSPLYADKLQGKDPYSR